MAELIQGSRGYDNPAFKEIQLDSTSSNTSTEILAEIAAFEAKYPCSKGSKAHSFNYDVFYVKKNDGTWESIL
jgi:hypothetical protein